LTIITRAGKGQALTHEEFDNNLVELRDKPDGQVYPSDADKGLRFDYSSPEFGWHDIIGQYQTIFAGPGNPSYQTYQGGIKQLRFTAGDELHIDFHVPHDYVPGTDIHVHVHWSHTRPAVTSGSVTWLFEMTYAKGHNLGSFSTPVTTQVTQDASAIRYQHMIAETPASAPGGAGGLLDTSAIEVDGMILVRAVLQSNTMDDSALPFVHTVDLHYQSRGLPTKNKSPDFYG